MSSENKVQWVYSARDNPELAERYDEWARDYDSDLEQDFGWIGPQQAVLVFSRYVPKSARVLDAGAGTGLVGKFLYELGYRELVAMDLSQGMLDEARKKGIYLELRRMVMGETLDFPTDHFDGVVSVGVLTVGHAPASSLEELLRVTKPGGYIVYTLRPDLYEGGGFKEVQTGLESRGKWKLADVSEKFQPLPKGEPDVYHQVWTYQVL